MTENSNSARHGGTCSFTFPAPVTKPELTVSFGYELRVEGTAVPRIQRVEVPQGEFLWSKLVPLLPRKKEKRGLTCGLFGRLRRLCGWPVPRASVPHRQAEQQLVVKGSCQDGGGVG